MIWRRRGARLLLLIVCVFAGALVAYNYGGSFLRSTAAAAVDVRSPAAREGASATFAAVSAAETFQLDNGLQVVVIPDAAATAATVSVWYKVGSVEDPYGKSGLAHFVEHLTFGGTTTLNEREFTRELQKASQQDAYTTYDYTVYYQSVSSRRLESALSLEAARMSHVLITEASLAAERREVDEEKRELDANALYHIDLALRSALFQGHPYGRSVLGDVANLASLGPADAAKFYRDWYVPNNAIVILHGQVDAATAQSIVRRIYGQKPARQTPPRAIPKALRVAAVGPLVARHAHVAERVWQRSYLAPSHTAGAAEHVYALQVLAELLGGGSTARLHTALVARDKLANALTVSYEPDSRDLSTLSIIALGPRSAEGIVIANAVDRELKAVITGAIPVDELLQAKEDLKVRTAQSVENMPAAVRIVGEAIVRGRSLEQVKAWPQQIDLVTIDEVRAAARAVFFGAPAATGQLYPSSR